MPRHWIGWIAVQVVFLSVFLNGCDRSPGTGSVGYIIRAGSVVVTHEQFQKELDVKLSAYPYNIKDHPNQYNEAVVDLVATLAEEALLLAAAQRAGVAVSTEELGAMENHIRASYPEDSFDRMLLENAVSHTAWQKRLEKSMVIDRFIQQELMDKIAVGPEDVNRFFEKYRSEISATSGMTGFKKETRLMEQLRREKGEDLYQEWIDSLQQKIGLNVDRQQVAGLLIGIEKQRNHHD